MHCAIVLNSCFNTKLFPNRYGISYEGCNVVRQIRFFVTNGFVPSMLVFLPHVRAIRVVVILSKSDWFIASTLLSFDHLYRSGKFSKSCQGLPDPNDSILTIFRPVPNLSEHSKKSMIYCITGTLNSPAQQFW